ncbi:MAG: hypothetical protein H7832_12575 [Magnetococcus sp. DMHC-6]
MLSKLPPIIALAPHSWHDRWLSRQQLLSRLAQRGWPVVYSYGALSVWERHHPVWESAGWFGHFETHDQTLLDYPGRFFPRWPTHPWMDRLAIWHHAQRLRRAIQANRDSIVFIFHPLLEPYITPLRPRWLVYHIYDLFSAMVNWSPELEAGQQHLIARADLLTASAEGMLRGLPSIGAQKGRILYNGADSVQVAALAGTLCPEDLAAIPKPRIGYIGTINSKVDLPMVLYVAKARPAWHWVFLGPVMLDGTSPRDRQAHQWWESCLTLPNIHYLGVRPRQAVWVYLHHMQVNTICYRIAQTAAGESPDWVVHGYPVKLHECLATGRPLVAGAQEVIQNQFSHVAAVVQTPESWLQALEQAITGLGVGTPDQRRSVALANTWENRVDTLEGWLKEMIGT